MGWPEVVTAISTAVIALVMLLVGVGLLVVLREIRGVRGVVQRAADNLQRDAQPVIHSVRKAVDDATGVVGALRDEADGFVGSVHGVRTRLNDLVVRVEDRLHDLDALVDVLQYEVEETALDVAAALRTTRRGTKVFRAMKRAFLRKGR